MSNLSCVLCQRPEETEVTGALSTKDQVTAHQNCLLFSSNIFCVDSPLFDDLFGFSTEDVKNEVKRGSKLICNKCKKKGATVGCEVKRCKKSYHYPCAVQEGAKIIEDHQVERYEVYCSRHSQPPEKPENKESVNGHETGSSKGNCPACDKTEGSISLESLSKDISKFYCDKHAPSSRKKRVNDDSSQAGPSGCNTDKDSPCSTSTRCKRRLTFSDKNKASASKITRRLYDESPNSDDSETQTPMEMFAPLESDLDENANSVPEQQLIRKHTEKPEESLKTSTTGTQTQVENRGRNTTKDEEFICSDTESESLLPADICIESQRRSHTSSPLSPHTASASYPKVILTKTTEEGDDKGSSSEENPVHSPNTRRTRASNAQRPTASPENSKSRPPANMAAAAASPETICVSLISSSPSPELPSVNSKPGIDSSSFWKSCNAAGCTQAIFTDFTNEMNNISSRIQSDQASQEDYDLALKVMEASGKLSDFVAKQQKELKRKKMELTKAEAAMTDVVSALKR